jgi:3-oxoacyl-[acyl-carrier-protein] synthase-3
MKKVSILSIGAYAPEKILSNADLEKMVDTTDQWIFDRTGIRERRIASDEMDTSEMAYLAAKDCMDRKPVHPDMVISSTCTPERNCPNQASIVSRKLGLKDLFAFDINVACSGFIFAMATAKSLLETMDKKYALITAGEKMSTVIDYKDRASCILFGDGASSVLLGADDPDGHEILSVELGSDPSGADSVTIGGKAGYFKQDGRSVYKFAVTTLRNMIELMKKRTGITDNNGFWVIPHQANARMMETVAHDMGIAPEKFILNIDKYGNTSSASIGLAWKDVWDTNRFKKGDIIFLIGFGGGLSWGAMAVKW